MFVDDRLRCFDGRQVEAPVPVQEQLQVLPASIKLGTGELDPHRARARPEALEQGLRNHTAPGGRAKYRATAAGGGARDHSVRDRARMATIAASSFRLPPLNSTARR